MTEMRRRVLSSLDARTEPRGLESCRRRHRHWCLLFHVEQRPRKPPWRWFSRARRPPAAGDRRGRSTSPWQPGNQEDCVVNWVTAPSGHKLDPTTKSISKSSPFLFFRKKTLSNSSHPNFSLDSFVRKYTHTSVAPDQIPRDFRRASSRRFLNAAATTCAIRVNGLLPGLSST